MTTKAYSGSCHCGDVKYQIRLTIPPMTEIGFDGDLENDFIVTSPANIEDVEIGWYFCKRCGVRTFGMGGDWVSEEIDVAKWAGKEDGDGKVQKVFKTTARTDGAKGYDGKGLHYVSANGTTLDEIDLIEAHDNGWIFYVENKYKKEGEYPQMRFKEPFKGGCY
ncbi:hypothetical protein N0V90_011324 [Kalmusia sp. IMI 367209]|nr:hypothetical protein N0V90_011324 [Kalmusia sp. IMI 367209]